MMALMYPNKTGMKTLSSTKNMGYFGKETRYILDGVIFGEPRLLSAATGYKF